MNLLISLRSIKLSGRHPGVHGQTVHQMWPVLIMTHTDTSSYIFSCSFLSFNFLHLAHLSGCITAWRSRDVLLLWQLVSFLLTYLFTEETWLLNSKVIWHRINITIWQRYMISTEYETGIVELSLHGYDRLQCTACCCGRPVEVSRSSSLLPWMDEGQQTWHPPVASAGWTPCAGAATNLANGEPDISRRDQPASNTNFITNVIDLKTEDLLAGILQMLYKNFRRVQGSSQ